MSFHQLDLFGFVNPVVSATKAPVVIETKPAETSSTLWAKTLAIPVMVLAAIASGENGRRPNFLPNGALDGAASLVADAYGIGLCRGLEIDDEEEITFVSSLSTDMCAGYSIESSKGGV